MTTTTRTTYFRGPRAKRWHIQRTPGSINLRYVALCGASVGGLAVQRMDGTPANVCKRCWRVPV